MPATLANPSSNEPSHQASGQISDNGQYVIFKSVATDLVPNFRPVQQRRTRGTDLYLRDTVGNDDADLPPARHDYDRRSPVNPEPPL